MTNKITICLVTANRPKQLKEALVSITRLNYKNYDLIVADDSFDDKSEKLVKKICPKAIYYRNSPPLKEILNSNKAINMAKTDIVCLFHDDDIFEKEYFDMLILLMNEDKNIDLAYTEKFFFDENNQILGRTSIRSHQKYIIYSSNKILDHLLLGKKISNYVGIMTPGLVFKKKLFIKLGGFDSNINTHYDTDLVLKLLLLSKKALLINKLLYKNRYWYDFSNKTKSSESGDVLSTQKQVIDSFILFSKQQGVNYYWENRDKIYKYFALKCLQLNGPLTWINIRFQGSYIKKNVKIFNAAREILKMNPLLIFNPKFHLLTIINIIIPQAIIRVANKHLIKLYLNFV